MRLIVQRLAMAYRAAALFGCIAMVTISGIAFAADVGGEVIARIGSIEIKSDELRGYIAALDPRDQVALAQNPALLSQSVRQLLAGKLVLQEALAKKWDQQPAIAAQIERVRQSTIVETYLQSVTKLPDGYPSDADLQSAYDANKTAFLQPRQFQLAQIFVAVAKDADKPTQDKARNKLDDIAKKLRQQGADFAAIAGTDSDDPASAKRGGEIGWVAEAQITPELRRSVIGLAKGAVADPLQLDDGWHIVKLLDTKAAYTRPLSEVRDQLADQLRRDRSTADRRAYLTKLLQDNPPAINELALGKIAGKPDVK
jgi:parvulin-like peptidyl-prolyl isomerase